MSIADIEAWRQRRALIIKRFGSADAATAPCARERLLLAAVTQWRTTSEGWTLAIDGWRGDGPNYRTMPARALQAIQDAIPLPTSFTEAKAETNYWQGRNSELEDVLSEDGVFAGDTALDLVAEVRAAIVRDLAMHELPIGNIVDLHDRFATYRETDTDDFKVEDALFRDIAAMAEAAEACPSAAETDAASQIRSALSANPSRSDRDVARSLRCSPTTVGRIRKAIGLRSSTRAVSRGGQRFEMRVTAKQAPKAQ